MKNRTSGLILFAAAFLSSSLLQAEQVELASQIDEIRKLLKPNESDTPQVKDAKSRLQSLPDTWQSQLDKEQLVSFSEYRIRGMGTELSALPELAAKMDALMKSVKQESDRRDAAKIAEAEAMLAQTREQLENAKKPEDLDALLLKLSKSKASEYGNNPKLSAISRDLQVAFQIVGKWQEYLMAKEAGNAELTRSNLQQISSQLSSTPIIPRSIVLRLLSPATPATPATPGSAGTKDSEAADTRISIDEIVAKLTESGDTATALAELKLIQTSTKHGTDETYIRNTIQVVDDLRKLEPSMSEAEVLANIKVINQNPQTMSRFSLTRAIDQIALNAIARSYGIEGPSAKTTSARKVLESIATSAKEKQDWSRLRQAITSIGNVSMVASYDQEAPKRANDLKIISLIELGKQAEQRNDFEAAAAAYLEASTIDGLYLQRDLAYAKLADLKQKNPDKVASILTKAEEKRQRAEAARNVPEIEIRSRR